MTKLRWGVLSTAKIATAKVIPAIQKAENCEVYAIASQTPGKAEQVAQELGIAQAHAGYDALLADPAVDVIYNPLPNNLHVSWTLKAIRAGKHVLCEKPLTNKAADVAQLIDAQQAAGVIVSEAFMIKAAPQWQTVLELISTGELGEVQAVQGSFFYRNLKPDDIRNRADTLGGAMLDIGCYPLTVARMVFGSEPSRVIALMDTDPAFNTDRLTSAILQFARGQCTFTVGTQTAGFQRVLIFGSRKHLEVRIPFNAPNDRDTEIWVHSGDVLAEKDRVIVLSRADQFTAQAEAFARAVRGTQPPLCPLRDSFGNAAAIEALFKSVETGSWQQPKTFP